MKKHTIDKLALMDEHELRSLFFTVRNTISKKRERRQHVSNLEIEMCYVQRELEIRKRRVQAHREFLEEKNKSGKHYRNRPRF